MLCSETVAIPRAASSLAFRLKEQEATLIDCANPAVVPLNPSQTISHCGLEGAVHPHFRSEASGVELNVVHVQSA